MIIYNRLKYIRTRQIKLYSTLVNFPLPNIQNSTNSLDKNFEFNSNAEVNNKLANIDPININKNSKISSKDQATATYLSTKIRTQLSLEIRDPEQIWELYTKLSALKTSTYTNLLQPSEFHSIIKLQFDLQSHEGYNRVLTLSNAFTALGYELTPKITLLTCESLSKLKKLPELENFIEMVIADRSDLLTTKLSNKLINTLLKTHQYTKAYNCITKLSNLGIQWDIHSLLNLTQLNLKLGKLTQFGQAYRSILINFNSTITTKHFNELLNQVLKCGHWNVCDRLLKDMKRLGLKPDLVTLTILMNSLLKLTNKSANKPHFRRSQCIDSIYKELSKNDKVELDDSIKLSFIKWYLKLGKFRRVEYLASTLKSGQQHVKFILLENYIHKGRLDKALEVYDTIQREGLGDDIRLYNLVGQLFWSPNLKIGKYENILNSTDNCESVGKFNLVIGYLISKMRVMDAYKLFQKHVVSGNVQADIFTYSALFKGLCSVGRNNLSGPEELEESWLTIAKEVYRQMEQTPQLVINLPVYNSILNTFSYFGDWEQVQQIYQTILDNDFDPNPRTIYPVIRMVLDNVPTEDLPTTLDQIPQFLSTPFYNAMLDAILRDNDLKGGFKILEHMLINNECQPDSLTYKILLVKASELQDIPRIQVLLQHCQDKGIEFNCSMYEGIIKAMQSLKTCPEYELFIYKVNMLRKVEEVELLEEINFEDLNEENLDWGLEENFHERLSAEAINMLVYDCFTSLLKSSNSSNVASSEGDNAEL
jgi:hypothetical protein